LMGSSAQHFHEVVRIAERIQQRWEMNIKMTLNWKTLVVRQVSS
jgi:hypothetical protein